MIKHLHSLAEHVLGRLFAEGIFRELERQRVGVRIFEHGLLVTRIVVIQAVVAGTDQGALGLR